MKNLKKGFTLIELLVVVAIIGVLASVVLASLNTARSKGANAAVKANLANMRPQMEIFYDGNSNSYDTACTVDVTVMAALAAADSAGGGANKCFDGGTSWVAVTELKAAEGTSLGWCVDSAGKSVGVTAAQDTAITSDITLCP